MLRSRPFLTAVGLAALVVLVSGVVILARRDAEPTRPNLLIFGDGGTYFSRAFATTPVVSVRGANGVLAADLARLRRCRETTGPAACP